MNLCARDVNPLELNFRWAQNHLPFSISPHKPNRQEIGVSVKCLAKRKTANK